jgi:hypothetical protein
VHLVEQAGYLLHLVDHDESARRLRLDFLAQQGRTLREAHQSVGLLKALARARARKVRPQTLRVQARYHY